VSSMIANLIFEFPLPSNCDVVKPSDIIGYFRCMRREFVRGVRDLAEWDENGVKLLQVYAAVDFGGWPRYSVGEKEKTPHVKLSTPRGLWWLPLHCFEEITDEKTKILLDAAARVAGGRDIGSIGCRGSGSADEVLVGKLDPPVDAEC